MDRYNDKPFYKYSNKIYPLIYKLIILAIARSAKATWLKRRKIRAKEPMTRKEKLIRIRRAGGGGGDE